MNRWMDECLTAAEETNEYSGSEHIVSACRLGGGSTGTCTCGHVARVALKSTTSLNRSSTIPISVIVHFYAVLQ